MPELVRGLALGEEAGSEARSRLVSPFSAVDLVPVFKVKRDSFFYFMLFYFTFTDLTCILSLCVSLRSVLLSSFLF